MRSLWVFMFILIETIYLKNAAQTFQSLTIDDGLSDMSINTVYKDREGYLWIGGSTALNRFDGKNIKQYPFSKSIPRTKSAITFTYQDSLKGIWVGNYAGIWKLDACKDTLYPVINEIDFPVYSVAESPGARLYLATYKGLYYYENGKCENISLGEDILSQDNQVVDVWIAGDNTVWILTTSKLYHYYPDEKKVIPHVFQENDEMFVFTGKGDRLFIGTKLGKIYIFDIRKQEFSCYLTSPEHVSIQDLQVANQNELYFLSKKIYSVAMDTHVIDVVYPLKGGEGEEKIRSFLVLPSGQLCVGSSQSGMLYSNFTNGLFKRYKFKDFDSQNYAIYSFYNKGVQKLIGTHKGLFYIDEEKDYVKNILQMDSLSAVLSTVNDIAYYNHKFYIFLRSRIYVLDEKSKRLSLLDKNEFTQGVILSMHLDRKGNLWIGKQEGLYCYQIDSQKIRFNSLDGLGYSLGVFRILSDRLNRIWLVTGERLCLFNPDKFCLYPISAFPADFPYNQFVTNICEESDGSMLFCMSDGKLVKLNSNIISFETIYTISNNQLLKAVLTDMNGAYWLATDCSVCQLLKNGIRRFNISDGLTCSNTTQVFQRDDKGYIWVGTKRGLFSLDPNDIEKVKKQVFPLAIPKIFIDGVSALESENDFYDSGVSIMEGQKIAFDCVLMNYSVPGTNSFVYKMEGYEDDWNICTDIDEIAYYQLPEGNYTFKIHSAEQVGNEKSISVVVKSKTNYAIIVLTFILLGTVCYLIYLKRKMPPDVLSKEMEEKGVEVKYATSKMDNESMEQIYQNLLNTMDKHEPWKNPDLKMHELANLVNCSPYSLSQVFSMYLKLNFNDFINQYRVNACKNCMADHQYDKYSLDAIYEFCGFSSRSSFFRWFKKYTGVTPNEYKTKL